MDGSIDYVYSGLNVIDEISSSTHEKHIYAGMTHIASNTTGNVEYYHVDHLGSTRLKTAVNGSVIYTSNYEPFGVSSGESGDEDYRYTGKPEDSTGLYYYGARYYNPSLGRFTTIDPMKGYQSDPQSFNPYTYTRNNPNKYIDPDGRVDPITITVVALIIIGWDIYEAHKEGQQRQLNYVTEHPDAPDYIVEREYYIGSTKKMVGNVVEKIPILKYTETTAMTLYENNIVYPSQHMQHIPGYDTPLDPYEGSNLVHDVGLDILHSNFKIPYIDNKETIVGASADIVISELWSGIEMYSDKIYESIFNMTPSPYTPSINVLPMR
ncbi:RHS repeat-associated core domain-containing protein [Candidatus Bathyarchaeota archaeon]|nr:MAG: RHS repeat-associated core domain-containing protein [Candidatus Bathyarchaeota archaeon]